MATKLNEKDKQYLSQCIDLAEEALLAGDKPFGSILVDRNGKVLATARNKANSENALAHPEYELAAWALLNLSEADRKQATMYTSGEHCPMCAGAHAWAGIGTIVYAGSGEQLKQWLEEFGADETPIKLLPVEEVIKDISVRGPAQGELSDRIKELHRKSYSK